MLFYLGLIIYHWIHLMMMMNCFCGMVDRQKAFSLISSRDHCQRSSPSWISDTPRAGFEPAQNLSSGLVEWSCAVVITTTPRCHPEDIADGILEMPGHLKPTMVMLKICVAPALWWQLVCKLSAIKEVN